MTIVGYLGLLIALLLMFIVPAQRLHIPPALVMGAALIRIAAVVTTVSLLATWDADANLYYFDTLGYTVQGFELGTSFVTYLTQFLKSATGGSIGDLMVIYALPGLIGIFVLMRFCGGLFEPERPPAAPFLFFLLPGFHFWTSWINKDGLSSLGIVLMIVGAANLSKRIALVVLGVIILTLVRPHIAAAGLAALGLAYGLSRKSGGNAIILLPLMAIAAVAGGAVFQSFLGIDIFDINQVLNLLADRQTYLATTNELDVTYIENPLLRMLSFLFMPLFIGADNALALLASFENLAILLLTGWIIYDFRRGRLFGDPLARFLAFFAILLVLLLGLTSYNVGLALRQKVMLYPLLIALLMMGEAARRRLAAGARLPEDRAPGEEEPRPGAGTGMAA